MGKTITSLIRLPKRLLVWLWDHFPLGCTALYLAMAVADRHSIGVLLSDIALAFWGITAFMLYRRVAYWRNRAEAVEADQETT